MKKCISVLVLMALVACGAFAQLQLSAGLGGQFVANFSSFTLNDDGKKFVETIDKPTTYYDQSQIGGGFFAFFDATYVMLSAGMTFRQFGFFDEDMADTTKDSEIFLTTFEIEALGKYPIALGETFTLFPVVGVDFKVATSVTIGGKKFDDEDSNVSEYFTTIWGKLGIGADIALGESFYLRPMILYGIGTNTKWDKELYIDTKIFGVEGIVNHGLDVKVAVGFKF